VNRRQPFSFFQGQVADVFSSRLYTIDGGNTPILSKLGALEIRLPFARSSRGLLRQHQAVHRPKNGGTPNPGDDARFRFRACPLRAFGNLFDARVGDPRAFLKEVTGNDARFETEESKATCAAPWLAASAMLWPSQKIAALILASNYDESGQILARPN